MIYPPPLKPGACIGVTAPSAGIDGGHLPAYERSLACLREQGYSILETSDVRLPQLPSTTGPRRAAELEALAEDGRADLILCAAGGDFLVELLPSLRFETLRAHPKWIQGFSDPTGLLYPVTTLLDIATIYGPNAGGFSQSLLHPYQRDSLAILRGETPVQRSFSLYAPPDAYADERRQVLSRPVYWSAPLGDFSAEGRLLGGCLDVLDVLRGTPYEDTLGFARRYEADGILWYFDVFAMTAEQVFYSLWAMRQAGWFRTASAFLLGRVAYPGGTLLTYEQAVRRALGTETPFVLNADVGHVPPKLTLINGALGRVQVKNGAATLEMERKR